MLIGGSLVGSNSRQWLDSINPTNEAVLGQIPKGIATDVEQAVGAAEAAAPGWYALAPEQRADYLIKVADKLEERSEEIARLEILETGHTCKRVRGDSREAPRIFRLYAGQCYELKGETISSTAGNYHITVREPFGVVGRIIPFNHPVLASARIGSALIAGNTIVLKPPKEASLSICLLGEICREVLPPGVVNIVTGEGDVVGEALVRHPRVKRISFTGSKATGLRIQQIAAESAVKKLTLELGGKNPMIVFPDADLGKALPAVLQGMSFAWSGQSCGSVSRLFLHDSIYDRSVREVGRLVGSLKVGDPFDEESDMGPIIHKAQYEKVLYYIKEGQREGAHLITGGVKPQGEMFKKGYWVRPTVFADVTPKMRIFKEEIFGPVLSIIRWKEIEEVIEMANAVEYGLTASVWTESYYSAFNTIRQIRSGYCWINGVSTHYKAVPFGGMKNSGIGSEEGLDDILSYTERKSIHILLNQ